MSTWALAVVFSTVVGAVVVVLSWMRLISLRGRARGMGYTLPNVSAVVGAVATATAAVTLLLLIVYLAVDHEPPGVAAIFTVTSIVGLISAFTYGLSVNDAAKSFQNPHPNIYPQQW